MMLLDGPAIAADLGLHPGTIRNWARAGQLTKHGRDRRGRALYDYDEVEARARRSGASLALNVERQA